MVEDPFTPLGARILIGALDSFYAGVSVYHTLPKIRFHLAAQTNDATSAPAPLSIMVHPSSIILVGLYNPADPIDEESLVLGAVVSPDSEISGHMVLFLQRTEKRSSVNLSQ